MKKFFAGLLAGLMVAGTATAFGVSRIKSANYNANTVSLNGTKINLSQPLISVVDEDSPAFESNYMPLRELLEKLGYGVEWQADKKNINLTKGAANTETPEKPETPTAQITKAQVDKMHPAMDSIILSSHYGSEFTAKNSQTVWDVLYLLVVNYPEVHDMIKLEAGDSEARLRDKAVQELATGCFADYDDLRSLPADTSVTFDSATAEYVFPMSDRGLSYTKIDSYKVNGNKAEVMVSLLGADDDELYGTFKFVLVPNAYADHVESPIFELSVESVQQVK